MARPYAADHVSLLNFASVTCQTSLYMCVDRAVADYMSIPCRKNADNFDNVDQFS